MDSVNDLPALATTSTEPVKAMSAAVPVLGAVPPPLPAAWTAQFEVVPEMPIIGSGAFATIFQVRDRQTHCPFACKVMRRSFFEMRGMGPQLAFEVQAMKRVASVMDDPGWSRVVRLYGAMEENGYVFLLLELCFNGNLTQQLAAHPGGLPEALVVRGCRHLLQGLREIHSVGIIHRDIKLDNLLITTNGVLKITDFGWATDSAKTPNGLAGTFETMAPEVLRGSPQTTAADMWSVGVVLFELVVGRPLLQADISAGATQLSHSDPQAALRIRQERLLANIEVCCPPSATTRPPHVRETCWDLLRRLLEPNVEQRISVDEALKHEWVNSSLAPQPMARPTQHADGVADHTIGTVLKSSAAQCTEVATAVAQSPRPKLEECVDKDGVAGRTISAVAETASAASIDAQSSVAELTGYLVELLADKDANRTPETASPRSSQAPSAMDSQCSSPRLSGETL